MSTFFLLINEDKPVPLTAGISVRSGITFIREDKSLNKTMIDNQNTFA